MMISKTCPKKPKKIKSIVGNFRTIQRAEIQKPCWHCGWVNDKDLHIDNGGAYIVQPGIFKNSLNLVSREHQSNLDRAIEFLNLTIEYSSRVPNMFKKQNSKIDVDIVDLRAKFVYMHFGPPRKNLKAGPEHIHSWIPIDGKGSMQLKIRVDPEISPGPWFSNLSKTMKLSEFKLNPKGAVLDLIKGVGMDESNVNIYMWVKNLSGEDSEITIACPT